MTTLAELLERIKTDTELLHQVVHGGVTDVVTTEGGDIKSLANAINGIVSSGTYARNDLDGVGVQGDAAALILGLPLSHGSDFVSDCDDVKTGGNYTTRVGTLNLPPFGDYLGAALNVLYNKIPATEHVYITQQLVPKDAIGAIAIRTHNSDQDVWSDWRYLHLLTSGIDSGGTPVGQVSFFAAASTPYGWLHCDGSTISRNAYADLFAYIGVVHGAGDGITTFRLPNLTNRFVRGSGDNAVGFVHSDQNKSHSHGVMGTLDAAASILESRYASTTNTWLSGLAGGYNAQQGYFEDLPDTTSTAADIRKYGTKFIQEVGGTEARPKGVVLYPCIKY